MEKYFKQLRTDTKRVTDGLLDARERLNNNPEDVEARRDFDMRVEQFSDCLAEIEKPVVAGTMECIRKRFKPKLSPEQLTSFRARLVAHAGRALYNNCAAPNEGVRALIFEWDTKSSLPIEFYAIAHSYGFELYYAREYDGYVALGVRSDVEGSLANIWDDDIVEAPRELMIRATLLCLLESHDLAPQLGNDYYVNSEYVEEIQKRAETQGLCVNSTDTAYDKQVGDRKYVRVCVGANLTMLADFLVVTYGDDGL